MKKINLIAPILGVGGIATTAGVLVGCSCNPTEEEINLEYFEGLGGFSVLENGVPKEIEWKAGTTYSIKTADVTASGKITKGLATLYFGAEISKITELKISNSGNTVGYAVGEGNIKFSTVVKTGNLIITFKVTENTKTAIMVGPQA